MDLFAGVKELIDAMFVTMLLFWIAVFLIVYSYVGYPILVAVFAKLINRKTKKKPIRPTIDFIVAVYNEERIIKKKIENTLNLEYPSDKIKIIIASDGSTDQTENIVKEYHDKRLRLLSLPRRGKIFALDETIAQSHGEIVVFSDANTFLHHTALKHLSVMRIMSLISIRLKSFTGEIVTLMTKLHILFSCARENFALFIRL